MSPDKDIADEKCKPEQRRVSVMFAQRRRSEKSYRTEIDCVGRLVKSGDVCRNSTTAASSAKATSTKSRYPRKTFRCTSPSPSNSSTAERLRLTSCHGPSRGGSQSPLLRSDGPSKERCHGQVHAFLDAKVRRWQLHTGWRHSV